MKLKTAWANSQVDAASIIPLKLVFASSCCTPVNVSIAWDSKWKAVVSWATKKSWTTVKLRWSSNAPITLSSVTITTQSLSHALFYRHHQGTISRQILEGCYYFDSEQQNKAYSGTLRTAESLSCCLENLQVLNHIRNRLISILRRCTFYQQSKACKAPLNKLLINQHADYPSWTTNIVINYDLKAFVSNKHVKIQCTFLPNYYALQLYKYIIAYGNSTQQLFSAVPVQASAEKSLFVNLRKEVVYTRLWWSRKIWNVGGAPTKSRRRCQAAARRSQKSATAAQANYRRRRCGAIGAGLYTYIPRCWTLKIERIPGKLTCIGNLRKVAEFLMLGNEKQTSRLYSLRKVIKPDHANTDQLK